MNCAPLTNCRACSSPDLRLVLSLGLLPLVNAYHPADEPRKPELYYPHDMVQCQACGLAQLGILVPSAEVFDRAYPYTSGTTRALRDNFANLASEATGLLGLKPTDLVLDIGSNDGTLLKAFGSGQRVVGVTPEDIGQASGVHTVQAYWDGPTSRHVLTRYGTAKLVTACNVAAHVPDVHGFFGAITQVLAPDGVLCLEVQYFGDLLKGAQYDHCYVEHQMWWALGPLQTALAQHGLEVFFARNIPTHGGSLRVYAKRGNDMYAGGLLSGESLTRRVAKDTFGPDDLAAFPARVAKSKRDLWRVVANIKEHGGRIVGVGAPSRAGTLIGYTGLSAEEVPEIWEHPESHKVGKFIPGTSIKVVAEPADLSATGYDVALLLNHHLASDMKAMLRAKGWSGKFITPLPEVRVE